MQEEQLEVVEETEDVQVDENDEFASIRAHYEQGVELTNDELDKIADTAVSYVRAIFSYFGENHVTVDEYDGEEGELILDASGGDLAVLIGRHGRTLDAVQAIVTAFMSNTMHFYYPIVVDIEGYKNRRKNKLRSIAKSAASRCKKQRGRVSLSPMTAYERRIVHLELRNDPNVTTHSEGEDPSRHVVVTYVRD